MNIRKQLLAACVTALTACGTANVDHGGAGDVGHDDADIQQALQALPEAHVLYRHANNVPGHVMGNLGTAGLTAASSVQAQLGRIAPVFRIQPENLRLTRTETDDLGHTHYFYQQFKNGLPVVAGDLGVHVNGGGTIYAVSSNARDGINVDATPRVAATDAKASARSVFANQNVTIGDARLVYEFASGNNELVLAYEMMVEGTAADGLPVREKIYVDAHTGAVADRHPMFYTAKTRKVYTANNGSSLPGTLKRSEGQSATGDAAIDAAYDGTGATYDFYKTIFNRDSYDNAGATLISSAHYGSRYNNAGWNGSQMVYGDGDGTQFKPLSEAVDVTAHELTHAVTERTAGLTYSNESGALNEAMSDIMGASTEAWALNGDVPNDNTWKLGEDIYTPATPGDALRYMNNPTQDGYSADYYPEKSTPSNNPTCAGAQNQDNGCVHSNSGIANLAYYLLVQGGHHPRNKTTIQVTGIGLDKARRIFYRALTTYFNSNTNFASALTGTKQAALDLYGQAEANSVMDAWGAVGVGSGSGGGGTTGSTTGSTTSGGGVTQLQNGVGLGNQSGAQGAQAFYSISVPSGASNLVIKISGGSGDADLYTKFGAQPTTSSYDCRPYVSGNSETCTVAAPQAGTYYAMLNGYAAYSGVTITASFTAGGGGTSGGGISNGGFEGSLSGWTAAGTTSLNSGGHSGSNAARVGSSSPTNGDSSVSQTFTAPSGSSSLSFWYSVTCPDTVTYDWATATLKDNTSGTSTTVLAKTCTNGAGWKQVSASVTAGHSYTLTLTSHDDNYSGDATFTLYDDVTVQ